MNSDKCRSHRPMQGTSAVPWGDDALRDFQFGCTGGSRGADGGAPVKRRTGREEKPLQDNSKKHKCAKFHLGGANLTRHKISYRAGERVSLQGKSCSYDERGHKSASCIAWLDVLSVPLMKDRCPHFSARIFVAPRELLTSELDEQLL